MGMDLNALEAEVKRYALAVLTRRYERLLNRKVVLFPWLRAKWLLRKIRIAKG